MIERYVVIIELLILGYDVLKLHATYITTGDNNPSAQNGEGGAQKIGIAKLG